MMKLAFPGPAYRIVTRRLVLRCWDPADAPFLNTAVEESRDHLKTFMPWAAGQLPDLQQRIDQIRAWRGKFDLGQDFGMGIFTPDETRIVGGTGLHTRVGADAREIGYWIHKDFTHQGFATEVSAALTRVAFEVDGVRRVEIHCAVENQFSAAVPKKLGFTHEATLHQRVLLADGVYHDSMIWTMLHDDYDASPCARAEIEAYDAMRRRII